MARRGEHPRPRLHRAIGKRAIAAVQNAGKVSPHRTAEEVLRCLRSR